MFLESLSHAIQFELLSCVRLAVNVGYNLVNLVLGL